jgi:hypothetical protein
MLVTRGGGKKQLKRKSGSRKNYKGGCGNMMPLNPAPLNLADGILGTSSAPGAANFTSDPSQRGFSNQIGGGYGFGNTPASLAGVPSYAGSYFPLERNFTAGPPDNNARGGNNFSQNGGAQVQPIGGAPVAAVTLPVKITGGNAPPPAMPAPAMPAAAAAMGGNASPPAMAMKGGAMKGGARRRKGTGRKGTKKRRGTGRKGTGHRRTMKKWWQRGCSSKRK